ncbi:lipopolysaccharide biosynthesis protein [Luteibacter aegosomatissinici]|uniref:lipopolysaccharide biosynthesis protein n=1 Tax=Luteibacter aegosomatissinici TaxID=2911539 RepID=UPI001FF9989A|nr:lipopolysaccharide biosynthesis protein [Luteibacter aegosomatissinici]UPG95682.1 lipopolysaccharide biosynthesis protein [Luteibacter aegosomatissinici]
MTLASRLRALVPSASVLRTSMATSAVLTARLFTQAATLVLLTRALGPSGYGAFASAAAIAVMLGILPGAGAGYVLLSRIEHDDTAPRDVWSYSWPIIGIVGTLLTPIFVGLAHLAAGDACLSAGLLVLMAMSELLANPFILTLSFVMQARGRVTLSQVMQWLPLALRVAAVAIAMRFAAPDRLAAYLTLQFAGSLACAWMAWRVARLMGDLHWRPRRARGSEMRQGASYALMNLIALNPAELDKVITLRVLGAHDAGIYAATARIVGAMVTPVTALLLSVQTRLFGRSAERMGDRHRMIAQVAVAALVWGAVSMGILEASSPWLPRLFGAPYLAIAQLMHWLALAAPLISLRISAGTILVSLGRPLHRICFEVGGVAVLCAAMAWLAARHGATGAAIALIIAEGAMSLIGWGMVARLIAVHRRERALAEGPAI